MKKTPLEKLIYKDYLKTSLISVVCIEVTLVLIYFLTNYNMTNKTLEFILNEIESSADKIILEKKSFLLKRFNDIESYVKILQKKQKEFFINNQYTFNGKLEFDIARNGMFYKSNSNEGSSLVVSNKTKITDELKNELIQSEIFDISFKSIVDLDEDIIAAYYNSSHNYTRYYPALKNSYNIFPSDIEMTNYNFYYLADKKHNPSKSIVWTDVYLDPAKKGWIISAIAPIYKKEELQGVTGIDIKLDSFINNFLKLNLPYNGKSFILNSDGKIIGMQKEIEKILGKKEVDKYEYHKNEKIHTTVNKSESYNILNSKNKKFAIKIKNLLKSNNSSFIQKLNNKNYIVFIQKIDKPSWNIVSLIEEEKITKEIKNLERKYNELGIIIVISIIIFYIAFFMYLNYKTRKFVKNIDTPIQDIIKLTKNLSEKKDIRKLKESNILEIDKLNYNFNKLIEELKNRTKNLIEEESKRIHNEKLANTDVLTGAYNRRYLEEFSINYLKIVKRENIDLSLLLIDLDDFKIVNDTYGHEEGDNVLKNLVKSIRDSIRDNDLIVRYGGDEFIVLLPDTNKKNAKLVAEKIKFTIDSFNNLECKYSVSIGVSSFFNEDVSINELIKRADKSLYEAKSKGKNIIV